jgi:hypothetical protein
MILSPLVFPGKSNRRLPFNLQNRLIQTSQTGGQWYNDSIPL